MLHHLWEGMANSLYSLITLEICEVFTLHFGELLVKINDRYRIKVHMVSWAHLHHEGGQKCLFKDTNSSSILCGFRCVMLCSVVLVFCYISSSSTKYLGVYNLKLSSPFSEIQYFPKKTPCFSCIIFLSLLGNGVDGGWASRVYAACR